MDQTLPWVEGAEFVGVSRPATPPEQLPPAATTCEEARPAAEAVERTKRCPAGHPYDEDNTYVTPNGWRNCRICRRDSRRRSRARSAKNLTPEQRALRSRAAAYRLHATHDPKETTKKARAAFATRFEREVDPEGLLPPAERVRRADAARRAYFTRLALRSSQARRRRR